MAVNKRTRFEVLRRDNFTCRYCRSAENELTIDHVLPVALGGTDDPANLVACCRDCNVGKSSSTLDEATVADIDADAARWSQARVEAARKWSEHKDRHIESLQAFLDNWSAWEADRDSLPAGWRPSVERWLDNGLSIHRINEAVDIAWRKPKVRFHEEFNYACGIIKNWLREIDELTRAELEANDAD